MIPAVAIASNTPVLPYGAKPPKSPKFEPWNVVTRKATITSTITASFQVTIALLARANQRIPTRFTQQKIASRTRRPRSRAGT